jgi:DNA-binding SARP family transcriptional activator
VNGLYVSLFGRFNVTYCKTVLPGFELNKVQELFAYLLLNHDRPQHRETLANLLWSDVPTSQSRRYLSKALWQLQTTLNTPLPSLADHLLTIEPDWIQLNSDDRLQCDVALFEKAFVLSQDIPGSQLDKAVAQALVEAVDLHSGELLEGWYQEWCLYERERFLHIFLMILDKLMDYFEAQDKFETSLLYGDRILRFDRAREHTHRRLIRLYYLSGDRTGALRQYQLCAHILEQELGVKPTRKTIELYRQIAEDEWVKPTLITSNNVVSLHAQEALKKLKDRHTSLLSLSNQLGSDIKLIETLLES